MCPKMSLIPTILTVLCVLSVRASVGFAADDPAPPVGNFTLNDTKGNPCFLLSAGVTFQVEYELKDNTTRTATYVLPRNSNVSGVCGEYEAAMSLSFFKGFNLTIIFQNRNDRIFAIASASVGYVRDPKLFPNAASPGTAAIEVQADGPTLFKTALGKSYLCKSLQVFDIGSTVKLGVVQLQVQPFKVKGMNFSEASECPQDPPSTKMPIQDAKTIPALNTTADTIVASKRKENAENLTTMN
ncbi:LAMP1 [Branchiostoma lanceolatum]|uniref:Lysosome-associated membrane glycoprotein 5 n=1 Tax=Branchiostoma lanceolatum TaxID=7740 RepID=A0A8K0ECW9_BRALA|nr:LAMP1 [Branchiostoma lanceolatum]